MKNCRFWPAMAVFFLALLAGAGPLQGTAQADNSAYLKKVDCWFDVPENRQADCAWFYPGDRAMGRKVRIPVVRLPGDIPDARPLLYIPGGPGYPAGLDAAGMHRWWHLRDMMRWPQELWLFDPRGTGLAQPAIDCPEIRAGDRASLPKALTAEQEYKTLKIHARACYDRLGGEQALKKFNSAREVADIAALLKVSGKSHWNLWAVSYGTRIAMHLLVQHPDNIRSVILDSAFPPEINGFMAKPEQLQRGVNVIVAACAQRKRCVMQHAKLRQKINVLLQETAGKPWHVKLFHGPRLAPLTLAVTDFRLLWMLFFDSYLTHFQSHTAAAIDAAVQGDKSALKAMGRRYVNALLDPEFSSAVYHSQTCAENGPGMSRSAYEQVLQRYPDLVKYLRFEWPYAVCRFWHAGQLPAAYNQPVTSRLPVLFVSGANDPATLPEWARAAAARMRHAKVLSLPGASHAPTFSNSCAMRSTAQFLQSPEAWRQPACATQRQTD